MLEPTRNSELPPIPTERYFTIGEVSDLCAVKPHVLRYWEQEFPQLKPVKRRGNRIIACKGVRVKTSPAIVLRAVLQKGGEGEVLAEFRIIELVHQSQISAVAQPECGVLIPLRQNV